MESALLFDRLQFAVTATFHYLFPQLTMGLALLLLYFRSWALHTGDEHYHEVARFWTKIFALSFAFGIVTGIPLEFQFGTNWAQFSRFCRRGDRPDARDRRRVCLLPGIVLSRRFPLRRKAAFSRRSSGLPR